MFIAQGLGVGGGFNIVHATKWPERKPAFIFQTTFSAFVLVTLVTNTEVGGVNDGYAATGNGSGKAALVGFQVGLPV
mgnify:CR=1 FL=1